MRTVSNKYYVRRNIKREFRKKFAHLFDAGDRDEVVRLARELIGYSPKTIDSDIYVTLSKGA